MKNKFLNRWSIIIISMLSFFGIFVGSFACGYTPGYDEECDNLRQLKKEVWELQNKLDNKMLEKTHLQKDITKYDNDIKFLKMEKDSLLILINEFDK